MNERLVGRRGDKEICSLTWLHFKNEINHELTAICVWNQIKSQIKVHVVLN